MTIQRSSHRFVRYRISAMQVVVLCVALTAGGGAAYLASGSTAAAPIVQFIEAASPLKTAEVLALSKDMPVGSAVTPSDLRWQLWPADGVTPTMVTRSAHPNAPQEFEGDLVRVAMLAGEPVRPERLIKGKQGGLMSAMLPPGRRALAINIDTRGTNSAGGFIFPNDRVDVIKLTRDEQASRVQGSDVYGSETLLKNVRVLAIGQNIQERNGEKVYVGETATLELEPKQVEDVFLAQRSGQLTLSLRSLQDGSKPEAASPSEEAVRPVNVRYSGSASRRFYCSQAACADGK